MDLATARSRMDLAITITCIQMDLAKAITGGQMDLATAITGGQMDLALKRLSIPHFKAVYVFVF